MPSLRDLEPEPGDRDYRPPVEPHPQQLTLALQGERWAPCAGCPTPLECTSRRICNVFAF